MTTTAGRICCSRKGTTWIPSSRPIRNYVIASRCCWSGTRVMVLWMFPQRPVVSSTRRGWVADSPPAISITTAASTRWYPPTTAENHWLTLKLVGHKSNRDAIGAVVKLVTSQGQQYATVTTASSYLSSSDKRVHFGLGPAVTAQTLEILWPSGIRQVLKDVHAGQILQVDEPAPPGSP